MNNKRILQPLHPPGIPSKLQQVNTGDKLVVRMVVTTDRNLEFVALKDNRAANLEPINQLSGSQWKENTLYYRTTTDASTQYFFNYLAKGTYVFEDAYYVNASGSFSGGTATIQCLYALGFIVASAVGRVEVK